jgi:kojibiose phosphorylase
MYRYYTLGGAQREAKERAYEGALYAWESADTGDEATPRSAILPDGRVITIQSGDNSFMLEAGAKILVETARFWVSRAQVESDGRAHIRQVIGPDEYHETVDDNAFTNAMAIFNLESAADRRDHAMARLLAACTLASRSEADRSGHRAG